MALTPIRFNGQAYETKVTDQNAQQLINFYPVDDGQSGKHRGLGQEDSPALLLYPTPGLTTPFVTLAAGSVVRAMLEHKGVLYAVAANKFYSINTAGTATEQGTISTSSGVVNMASIFNEIVMVDGTAGFSYKISGDTFAEITDADFPDTAIQITSQDTFFLVEDPTNEGRFFRSDAADGTAWGSTAFATMEAYGERLQTLISLHRELYLVGERHTEVWCNTGESTVTFERIDGIFINMGTSAKDSVAIGDNTLFWLGQDTAGDHIVVRLNGYIPQIISTRGISFQISQLSTVSDAVGFAYRQEGHEFYVLTFPTAERTFVYDATTGLWHERKSVESASQNRWRANAHAYFNNKQYVGDYNSGIIYEVSTSTFQENTATITRTRTTAPIYFNGNTFNMYRIQIDFETAVGSDPTISLALSKDGGNTFQTAIDRIIDTSEKGSRVIWNRIGSAREMVFKLTTTANAQIIVLGAVADLEIGVN